MKHIYILFVAILFVSCSNDPNQIYIDKVAEKVRQNEMGLDVGYRNIEFEWIDTTYAPGPDGSPTDLVVGYQAKNTYRIMVGTVNEKVIAIVTFDRDFNVIEIE